ncbi:Condensation domain-containing protein [Cinnamomum micranthum f. kanehirae]|uniref:Condensation domain-containing protein n=1 Tax=Cinnamomum micranthum f. kanehirae TaxID=337451 RepID=A0A3S3QEZ9_9MAGN|nr:Condensation domain-containing protein [Cinnamomum micranthum f. kanehirae]
MSDDPNGRAVGGTEYSLCRAVPGGSGITVVALLLSHPPNLPSLQNTLHKLQKSHPILRSKLQNPTPPSPSFSISTSPSLQIQTFDLPTTTNLLKTLSPQDPPLQIPPFHLLLEHQLNQNPWSQQPQNPTSQFDVFYATLYSLSESRWVVALRLHGSVCDRTSAVVLAREVVWLMREGEGGAKWEIEDEGCGGEVGLAIEELVPKGKGDKPFWARGADLVGYPLNYIRTANLGFEDICTDRRTEVVRFQLDRDETDHLLSKCRERDIKLSGAIAAAALIAANSSKHLPNNQSENYAVLTLVDCRGSLDPAPLDHHLGFYHSGILNMQSITKGERLWDVAKRCYTAFSNALKCNKHFTDMGVLIFSCARP